MLSDIGFALRNGCMRAPDFDALFASVVPHVFATMAFRESNEMLALPADDMLHIRHPFVRDLEMAVMGMKRRGRHSVWCYTPQKKMRG